MPDRPNVLFVMADQFRGDCVGADPNALDGVRTPALDALAERGTLFSRAYTPAPTCVPARRCLWSGQTPATNTPDPEGRVPNAWHEYDWDLDGALPRVLRNRGYQTLLAGKTHSFPFGNRFGFERTALHTGLGGVRDDYTRWLDGEFPEANEESHGAGPNDWTPRPWHLPERAHPTEWTTRRALDLLDSRDPTRPFFLTVSYVRPHQPFDPPSAYWKRQARTGVPDPVAGDWAEAVYGDPPRHPPPDAWHADLDAETVRRARVGYLGSVAHVDAQVGRLLDALDTRGEREETLVVFASDHGEMLGDHHLWKKGYGYEGSARIPLLVDPPAEPNAATPGIVDRPVGLEDISPTVLDAVGVSTPDTVEGRSLLELRRTPDRTEWRPYYHGEVGPQFTPELTLQYLVTEDEKYVWNPVTGEELLFDLAADPREQRDLSSARPERRRWWRDRLVERLRDRPEGFVEDGALSTVSPDAWA
jgi:arylsulfatase